MTQNNGLRCAFRAGSEQDDCLFITAGLVRHTFVFVTQVGVYFFPQTDFVAEVFQINNLETAVFQLFDNVFHFGVSDKQAGGNDFFDNSGLTH